MSCVEEIVNITSAAIIGAIADVIVVFAVGFFDSIKIDDPVGATSVHLVCGTLALGIFSQGDAFGAAPFPKMGLFFGGGFEQLMYQAIGSLAVGGFTVAFSFIAWYAIAAVTGGIRVHAEEELKGLDISEHGMEAYSGFFKEALDGEQS